MTAVRLVLDSYDINFLLFLFLLLLLLLLSTHSGECACCEFVCLKWHLLHNISHFVEFHFVAKHTHKYFVCLFPSIALATHCGEHWHTRKSPPARGACHFPLHSIWRALALTDSFIDSTIEPTRAEVLNSISYCPASIAYCRLQQSLTAPELNNCHAHSLALLRQCDNVNAVETTFASGHIGALGCLRLDT